MGEQFKVDADEVAGLGGGIEDLAAFIGKVKGLVDSEGGPGEGWNGLMSELKSPFETAKTNVATRYHDRQTTVYMTGNELISLANLYRTTDKKNSAKIRNASQGLAHDSHQQGDADTSVAHYGTEGLSDLTAPAHEEADVVSLVREKAAWVADADEAIQKVSGWSPINDTFEKVIGNWAELSRIGKVYEKAGAGMESAGKDIATMSKRAESHWDGESAQAYDKYAKKLAKALEAEGPLTKVVKDCLDLLVDEIKKLVKTLVEMLVEKLKEEVKIDNWQDALKVLAKKIPVAGTAWQVERLAKILWDLFQEAQKLVEQVKKAVELVKNVVDFLNNPIDYLKQKGKEKMESTLGKQNDGDPKKQLQKDLPAAVLSVPDFERAPDSGYWGGTGADPWKDGQ